MDPIETLSTLSTAVQELEAALSPILAIPLVELLANATDSLEKAKLDVTLAYVVHDLIWSTSLTLAPPFVGYLNEIGSILELLWIAVLERQLMLSAVYSLSEDCRRRSCYPSRHGRTGKSISNSHSPLPLRSRSLLPAIETGTSERIFRQAQSSRNEIHSSVPPFLLRSSSLLSNYALTRLCVPISPTANR